MGNSREVEVETVWLREQRRRRASRFLKGPIPLALLQEAARLRGRALALYLVIRHRTALRRSPELSLPTNYLAAWGIDKDAKRRAITALERAGLVRVVDRGPGRSLKVALIKPANKH